MGRFLGFVSLLIVLGTGFYLYTENSRGLSAEGSSPKTLVDVTAVRNDLLAMANAERRYWAMNSKYGSLEDLRTNGDIHIPTRPTYSYSSEVSDSGFRIIATYAGPDSKAPKHLRVDESMSISSY